MLKLDFSSVGESKYGDWVGELYGTGLKIIEFCDEMMVGVVGEYFCLLGVHVARENLAHVKNVDVLWIWVCCE